ncbi:MAG: hypothetical protein J7K00_04510 [Candidatus Diapherotrites archaeon]|nr:hypothetical protein [Candidatus Diapherotrites archaeon]
MAKKHIDGKKRKLAADSNKNAKKFNMKQAMDYVGIAVILLIAVASIYYVLVSGSPEKMKDKFNIDVMLSKAVKDSMKVQGKSIEYFFFLAPNSKVCVSDAVFETGLEPENMSFDFSRLTEEPGALDGFKIPEEENCLESVSEKDQNLVLKIKCENDSCNVSFSAGK